MLFTDENKVKMTRIDDKMFLCYEITDEWLFFISMVTIEQGDTSWIVLEPWKLKA